MDIVISDGLQASSTKEQLCRECRQWRKSATKYVIYSTLRELKIQEEQKFIIQMLKDLHVTGPIWDMKFF